MISTLYIRRTDDDPEAQILLNRIKMEGYNGLSNLIIEKAVRFEGISREQALLLKNLFCHPVNETLSSQSDLKPKDGPIFEVGYQRAVTDPELPSILRSAHALGVHELIWARIAHRYQFQGLNEKTAREIINHYLYNPQVQVIIEPDHVWTTLRPQGRTGPVEQINLENLSDKELMQLNEERRLFLNLEQMKALRQIALDMKRSLTDAEVEMFAQTWSDHCFHTTWKSLGLLKKLFNATNEIDHPLVLSKFEDNAGAMAFYDGWALTIKGETHNSPTAVSPYGGIMTKHGGVIRDTLGCGEGALPIGGSTIMGLGDPFQSWQDLPPATLHPRTILIESIRGTADYCNPMGIPMMFPYYRFHPGYTGKCFALGHSIGLFPADRAKKGHPESGDYAVLIGGYTGRDGLHGATVSSDSMTDQTSTTDASHVQIGHPIEERKFMEAIPVLRDTNCLRAVTDLGAAGLSSAAGEMGSESGVWINLAWVPLKTEGLHPWEIWISESQERMLLCVPPEKISEALSILERYEVSASIIGQFTDTNRCQVVYDPSVSNDLSCFPEIQISPETVVVDLDFKHLRKGCPLPGVRMTELARESRSVTPEPLTSETEWSNAILSVIGHLNICDQSPAGTQFDSTVQGRTVIGPYGGIHGNMPNDIWASAPLRGKKYGAVAAIAYNPFYGEVNPAVMSKLMIIESVTKLVTAGVRNDEIVLCDNFYTPRINPEVASQLTGMVTMCTDLSRRLGLPFISGKDSSNGTFMLENGERIDVPPTLCVMALGRIEDVGCITGKAWKKPDSSLLLVGPLSGELGGSIYYQTRGHIGQVLPDPSIDQITDSWQTLLQLAGDHILLSASAVAEGGLFRRLFEMALGSGMGCDVNLSQLQTRIKSSDPASGLFTEMIGAVVIEAEPDKTELIMKKTNAVFLGKTIVEPEIRLKADHLSIEMPMDELTAVWQKPFQEIAK